jgi:D-alanine-D-alanine ligase
LAVECWRLFGLAGYARVDFRCDEAGRPWILEINANPCLLPGAGFAAALERAGIGYDEGIQLILDAALRPNARSTAIRAGRRPLMVR